MSTKGTSILQFVACVWLGLAPLACGDGEVTRQRVATAGAGGSSDAGAGGTDHGGSGAGTGGSSAGDGGSDDGGSAGAGGSDDGGSGGIDGGSGAGTGGADHGGNAGTAGTGGGPIGLCGVEIVAPENDALITEDDDANQDCEDGLTISVRAAAASPNGQPAQLFVNGSAQGSQAVTGQTVRFQGVSLNANASNEVTVRVGDCSDTIHVTTECPDVPTCQIVSPTTAFLNGVPAASGGDRTSPDGSPYATEVRVNSNIASGEVVSLTIDGVENTAAAFVSNGTAVFTGVSLTPDGEHTLRAVCRSESGRYGQSSEVQVIVDSAFPDLDVNLVDGEHFAPEEDVDSELDGLQFNVCGLTEAADAIDNGTENLCVAIGSQSPICTTTSSTGALGDSGGCVVLTCPGSAPFDVVVSVSDQAGNRSQKTVAGITCASVRPSVQIVAPADGTSILSASMPAPHEENASLAGAQSTVVTCTNSTAGTARLFAGQEGSSLQVIATTSVATAQESDNCPAGLSSVARFSGVTLPESAESLESTLVSRTQLRVEVTDQSTEIGVSGNVNVWVDSIAPLVTVTEPINLCGLLFQSDAALNLALRFSVGSRHPLSVTVAPNGGAGVTEVFGPSGVPGLTEYRSMSFALGTNEVSATITEPSGNVGALETPCIVTVGTPPVVVWTTPTSSSVFNAGTDADPNTPGWQGSLQVNVTNVEPNATLQFALNGTNLGAPVVIQPNGDATLTGVTIPESGAVTLRATTDDLGKGPGTASIGPFVVDVTIPDAVTGLTPRVQHRRQTTFRLEWSIPADGEAVPSTYEVRVSQQAIDASNFDAAERVNFSNACPGGTTACADVKDRLVEHNYYFAVASADAAGNRGPVVSAGPLAAHLNATVLRGQEAPGSDERFGVASDGSASLNGDPYADLIVGSAQGNKAYIWFGRTGESGYAATPDVTIIGPAGVGFSNAVSVIGDIDSDGLNDIAIGAPYANTFRGRVYVFRGRESWPSVINADTEADTVIEVTSSDAMFTYGLAGTALARLGDFNQDGYADFGVAVSGYDNSNFSGYVAVILGAPNTTAGWDLPASITIPDDIGTFGIGIKGDPSVVNGAFGYTLLGLGGFFGTSAGDTLVASTVSADLVYAFAGRNGDANGEISIGAADDVLTGSGSRTLGGALGLLGSFAGRPAVAIGDPRLNAAGSTGRVFVHFGAPEGPFSGPVTEIRSSVFPANSVNRFGYAVMGSGISGTSVTTNLLGNAGGDLAISGNILNGGPSPVYLFSGETIRAASGGVIDASTAADVAFPLSSVPNLTGWRGTSYFSSTIHDSNGDGFADLAVGEYDGLSNAAYDGRLIVIW